MVEKSALIAIRPYKDSDKNFIFSTWLRGLYYGDSWFQEIPKDIFMRNYQSVLENLFKRQDLNVKVACLKDDPEVILGYAVTRNVNSQNVLDYIFVKSAWRKIGIAKSLVPTSPDVVTHLTKVGKALKRSAIFNPFI